MMSTSSLVLHSESTCRPRDYHTGYALHVASLQLLPRKMETKASGFAPGTKLVCCREPRGIGFLEYSDPRDAEDAKDALDRAIIHGREVSYWQYLLLCIASLLAFDKRSTSCRFLLSSLSKEENSRTTTAPAEGAETAIMAAVVALVR